jgi:hypothetical protein
MSTRLQHRHSLDPSVLLEQPFKDTSWWEDPQRGWSPERANQLGASLPMAILAVLARLRVC